LEDVRLKPPTSGLKAPIPRGNQRQVIVTVPFADGRQITNRCGMQKGGYGNETKLNDSQWTIKSAPAARPR
jgi:hypothetical protein